MAVAIDRCGWAGSVSEFLDLNENEFISSLESSIQDVRSKQIDAWKDCFNVMQDSLKGYANEPWALLFEYELPRQGGRRPDVILLLPGEVLVLEFKMQKTPPSKAEWGQLSSYVRDLSHYHEFVAEENLHVRGALVLSSYEGETIFKIDEHRLLGLYRFSLKELLSKRLASGTLTGSIHLKDFLESSYQPLPTIIEAAKMIMKDEALPAIKQVNNTNIPQVLDTLEEIVKEARSTKTHHLVLVSGVPGAGKTLVGLKFSYFMKNAVYLSGNGPLVDVLQDTLQSKSFVQALKNYKHEYLKHGTTPQEHVIIFDEAQRAWDKNKMNQPYSEPDLIIKMAQENKEWSVVIGLIGDGQEIHVGEEAGLSLWNDAIKDKKVIIHSHDKVKTKFHYAEKLFTHQHLNLNQSLRSHLALDWHAWVNLFLEGDFPPLNDLANKLREQRFTIYVTRDLILAKKATRKRYAGEEKQFGLVASSKRDVHRFTKTGIEGLPKSKRYTMPSHVAFFNDPQSLYYSSHLTYAATEFDIQGLELDQAIVCWGYDYLWNGSEWVSNYNPTSQMNPRQLRLNSYRVLLTRGRDGVIVYIPDESLLDETYKVFLKSGAIKLGN
ncbi:DUF2075 domain-containing protein [Alkalihalophilus marmarensis]|jgi:hypothetical protein|uniref:DNA/RNA helicase domain-containing protein n=1 Tax=Alkalihalophilus marmarensis TaxID=521377 RepID=UPI0020401007|nr:DNA/RNA helicase domain-containing protein [Alkalihalophilus marmarensis]MCM3491170.1 DUF2075 domain-containing protein [Alkalihalophilus marmarensis]